MENIKFVIFSDFDNTITTSDILDNIIIDIYSWDTYKKVENLLLEDKLKYEQYLFDMFDGIEYNLDNISNNLGFNSPPDVNSEPCSE